MNRKSLASGWIRQLDNVLEWSYARKSMLVMMILLPILLQYTLLNFHQRLYPSPYINNEYLQLMTPIHFGLIIGCLVIILLCRWLERYEWSHVLLAYLSVSYYALSLVYLAYFIGIWCLPVGLVLAGAPIFGFILFPRQVIYTALMFAFGWICMISVLTAMGYLAYSPLFYDSFYIDPAAKPFLLFCYTYFALPHLFSILLLSDLFLIHWRRREEIIHQLSLTDSLTRLNNRRAITHYLQKNLEEAHARKEPLSVILVDLDHFKAINDNFGHLMGDEALRRSSECMREVMRKQDQLGRYGGEEFLIVLGQTGLDEAIMVAERCRRNLEQTLLISEKGERIPITASFGVYCSTRPDESVDEVIHEVDHWLYFAKEHGRNRVCHVGSKPQNV